MPTRLAVLRVAGAASTFHTSSALPAAMVVPWSRPVISPASCWTAEVPACSKVQESFQPPSALASDGAGSAVQLSSPTSEGAALTPYTRERGGGGADQQTPQPQARPNPRPKPQPKP